MEQMASCSHVTQATRLIALGSLLRRRAGRSLPRFHLVFPCVPEAVQAAATLTFPTGLPSSAAAIVKKKLDPTPSSDSTQIVPPNPSMIFLHTARPRPVPGT